MVNKIILIGRVGKAPEISSLTNGTKVARFSLATSESYKDKDGNKKEQTEWHNLTLWRGLAEVAEKWVHQGQMLYVEGKMHYSQFEKDGLKHYRSEVVVDEMRMLQKANTEPQAGQRAATPTAQNTQAYHDPAPMGEDDLPF